MKLKTLHIKNPSKELLLFLRNLRDNKRRNNESTFTIRIERNGCKKYSFVLNDFSKKSNSSRSVNWMNCD